MSFEFTNTKIIVCMLVLIILLLSWNTFNQVGRYQIVSSNEDYLQALVLDTVNGDVYAVMASNRIRHYLNSDFSLRLHLLDRMETAKSRESWLTQELDILESADK